MLKYRILSLMCVAGAAVMLSGCPQFHPTQFLLTINNVSEDAAITEIRIKAPGSNDFGTNRITGDLDPEESTFFLLEAPFTFLDESGVTYEVQITHEILGDLIEVRDTGTFRAVHAGESYTWQWEPGSEPDVTLN